MANTETVGTDELPKYNRTSNKVIIPPEIEALGIITKRIFDKNILRLQPWFVSQDGIAADPSYLTKSWFERSERGDFRRLPNGMVIITDEIEKEVLTDPFVKALEYHEFIEDFLPYFTGRGDELYRYIWGMYVSYLQWGREEYFHSEAAKFVLSRTQRKKSKDSPVYLDGRNLKPQEDALDKPISIPWEPLNPTMNELQVLLDGGTYRTMGDLEKRYYQTIANTWELSYPTYRLMTCYAFMQEPDTAHSYEILSQLALNIESPITAEVMSLISKDERFHGAGFRRFLLAMHEMDPEGTKRDLRHVVRDFEMPAQGALKSRKEIFRELVQAGYFDIERTSRSVFTPVLQSVRFLSEAEIADDRSAYEKHRITSLEKRVQLESNGLILPR